MDGLLLHLDAVELLLTDRIAERFGQFLTALCHVGDIRKRLDVTLTNISALRKELKRISDERVEQGVQILRLTRRRTRCLNLIRTLELLSSVRQAQPSLQLLLASQDFGTALDLVESSQAVLRDELSGIYATRHAAKQLQELGSSIDRMLEADFVHASHSTLLATTPQPQREVLSVASFEGWDAKLRSLNIPLDKHSLPACLELPRIVGDWAAGWRDPVNVVNILTGVAEEGISLLPPDVLMALSSLTSCLVRRNLVEQMLLSLRDVLIRQWGKTVRLTLDRLIFSANQRNEKCRRMASARNDDDADSSVGSKASDVESERGKLIKRKSQPCSTTFRQERRSSSMECATPHVEPEEGDQSDHGLITTREPTSCETDNVTQRGPGRVVGGHQVSERLRCLNETDYVAVIVELVSYVMTVLARFNEWCQTVCFAFQISNLNVLDRRRQHIVNQCSVKKLNTTEWVAGAVQQQHVAGESTVPELASLSITHLHISQSQTRDAVQLVEAVEQAILLKLSKVLQARGTGGVSSYVDDEREHSAPVHMVVLYWSIVEAVTHHYKSQKMLESMLQRSADRHLGRMLAWKDAYLQAGICPEQLENLSDLAKEGLPPVRLNCSTNGATSLKTVLQDHCRAYLDEFHHSKVSEIQLMLDSETWVRTEIPSEFQKETVSAITGNPGFETGDSRTLLLFSDGPGYQVCSACLAVIQMLIEYINFAKSLPIVTPQCILSVSQFILTFHHKTFNLILEGGALARERSDMETITANNLALCARSLACVAESGQLALQRFKDVLTKEYDTLPFTHRLAVGLVVPESLVKARLGEASEFQLALKKLVEHEKQVFAKLSQLLVDSYNRHSSDWFGDVHPPPLSSANTNGILDIPPPHLAIKGLRTDLTRLYKVLVKILTPENVNQVFAPAFDTIVGIFSGQVAARMEAGRTRLQQVAESNTAYCGSECQLEFEFEDRLCVDCVFLHEAAVKAPLVKDLIRKAAVRLVQLVCQTNSTLNSTTRLLLEERLPSAI
eukprot:GHVN01001926.1.p1 GENE.GHVN01001926.1~~GHVN01001926.1.p1  ORF type:complete len:1165 (+),score=113.48 GHVN01001926.1:451-3495(+)